MWLFFFFSKSDRKNNFSLTFGSAPNNLPVKAVRIRVVSPRTVDQLARFWAMVCAGG